MELLPSTSQGKEPDINASTSKRLEIIEALPSPSKLYRD
jgi:hypothetical protein